MIDLTNIPTPDEFYRQREEERVAEREFRREMVKYPPIGSRRGVEYYTGKFYGDD